MLDSVCSFDFTTKVVSYGTSWENYGCKSVFSFVSPKEGPGFSPTSATKQLEVVFLVSLFLDTQATDTVTMWIFPSPTKPVTGAVSFLTGPYAGFD